MKDYKSICADIENVENYKKAKADNFKGWVCHHRLGTHTSDGERRPIDIEAEELKALGMYYNRPANELVFLTRSEHAFLHQKWNTGKKCVQNAWNKGMKMSEEFCIKSSEAHKGQHAWNKGVPMSDKQKEKLDEVREAYRKSGRKDWNAFQKEYKEKGC